jgi:hypothetical protein
MACRWSSQTPKILFISRAFRNGSFISTLSLAITSRGLKPRFETSVIVAFFAFSKASSLFQAAGVATLWHVSAPVFRTLRLVYSGHDTLFY